MTIENQPREWLRVPAFRRHHPEFGSSNFIYRMAHEGKLLSIKVGGRVLIASDALDILAEE